MAYESAIAYDAVHAARGKDYAAEAGQITALIRAAVPRAASLLDLACGSGGHLAHFQRDFADVVGLDASQVMLDAAAIRAPSAQLVLGDLADFDLGRRFDAIVCLFSSLGYLRDTGRLRSAAASIARHLNREGSCLSSRGRPPSSSVPAGSASTPGSRPIEPWPASPGRRWSTDAPSWRWITSSPRP